MGFLFSGSKIDWIARLMAAFRFRSLLLLRLPTLNLPSAVTAPLVPCSDKQRLSVAGHSYYRSINADVAQRIRVNCVAHASPVLVRRDVCFTCRTKRAWLQLICWHHWALFHLASRTLLPFLPMITPKAFSACGILICSNSQTFQITANTKPCGVNVQNLLIGHIHLFMVFSGLRDMDMQGQGHNRHSQGLDSAAGR